MFSGPSNAEFIAIGYIQAAYDVPSYISRFYTLSAVYRRYFDLEREIDFLMNNKTLVRIINALITNFN